MQLQAYPSAENCTSALIAKLWVRLQSNPTPGEYTTVLELMYRILPKDEVGVGMEPP
jgi:hypothetical protein